jgi:hypothetical protein
MSTGKQTFVSIARLVALTMFAFAATALASGPHDSKSQPNPILAGSGLLLIAIPRSVFRRENKSGLFLVPQKTRVSGL